VQLKSGGYIVINPTEALVSIDVNSGRATRERNIEETALKTNLEAADEIARHLRLRDLAGLIVIDFIDMEVGRNNVKVEKRLKDAMRLDRARIQLGRISPFGLLELSRQRLRPSLIETSSETCPYCAGSGIRRSTDSAALKILRAIEEEGIRGRADRITVHVQTAVALYILNQKRGSLADLESRYGFSVIMEADDSLIPPDHRIERLGEVKPRTDGEADSDQPEEDTKRRRRRRSRRHKGEENAVPDTAPESAEAAEAGEENPEEEAPSNEETAPGKRRRRGKRGGRRRTRKPPELVATGEPAEAAQPEEESAPPVPDAAEPDKPAKKPARRRARKPAVRQVEQAAPPATPPAQIESASPVDLAGSDQPPVVETPAPKAAPRRRRKPAAEEPGITQDVAPQVSVPPPPPAAAPHVVPAKTNVVNIDAQNSNGSQRKGWWQRLTD
jgi:ribonuclease E